MTAQTRPRFVARFTHASFECIRWTQTRQTRTITGYRSLQEPLESFSPQTASRLNYILNDLQYDKTKDAITLVIPHQRVTVQYVRLPSSHPDEISSMVGLQAVKLFPAGESLITASRIVQSESRGSALVNAVLVQSEVVTSYVNLLSEAGASVDDVFLDVYGFESFLPKPLDIKEVSLLINIENDFCQAAMMKGGSICVSRGFFVDRTSAQWQEKLLAQVLETESMYFKIEGAAALRRVIMAVPDPAERSEYRGFFREQLPQEVHDVSLDGVQSVSCQTDIPGFPDRLTGSLGFILRQPDASMSLMPLPVRQRRRQALGIRRSVRVLVCAMLAVILFAAAGIRYLSRKAAFLQSIKQEISALQQDVGRVEHMADQLQAVRDLSDEKKVMLDFVTAVHQVAPSGLMVEEIQYDDQGAEPFSLSGYSYEREAVFSFATQLSEFEMFGTQAQVKYADRVDTPDRELIKYKIAFMREKPS
jgi:Tfp pilus assembly protein PilN